MSTPTANRLDAPLVSGADAAVAALGAEGVEQVFGLPGTTIMDLLDSLVRQESVRYMTVRHEQAAAHMADGYFRVSRKLACCLASRGPGAANMAIGVHNAFAESIPVLALVGQVPDSIAYRDSFEEMDLLTFFAPLTKWRAEVHVTERIPEFVARAARTAMRGRPRPVLLSLPLDVQQGMMEDGLQRASAPLGPSMQTSPCVPSSADVEAAVQMLLEAERPLIVAGGGIIRPWWDEGLIAVAEGLETPVVSTWLRKGVFPNDHRLFGGSLGFGASPTAEQALAEADVVLAVGCRFSEFTTKRWTLPRPETRVIQIDIDAEEVGSVHHVALGLVGDASATVGLIAGAIEDLGSTTMNEARARRAASLRAEYERLSRMPEDDGDGDGVHSASVLRALARVLDRHDAMLFQDAHSFGPWIARHLPITRPGAYWGAAGGSMGWGLPAALGAQVAVPERRIVAVCGDGSFWMVAQELETAVRERLPVVVVVTNNFAYGNTRDRQRLAHDGRYLGVFYDNPDFAAFARLLGAHGERVERADELEPALERALASGLPAVVDVIQSPWEGLPADLAPPPAR